MFRREDGMWRLCYAGREAMVADGKGLRDLATLLAAPGKEVTAMELLGVTAPAGADAVLDAQARAAYRVRLAELSAEVERAESAGDADRAESARAERAFLARAHPELGSHLDACVRTGVRCGYYPARADHLGFLAW